jgi:hypothetical protein
VSLPTPPIPDPEDEILIGLEGHVKDAFAMLAVRGHDPRAIAGGIGATVAATLLVLAVDGTLDAVEVAAEIRDGGGWGPQ